MEETDELKARIHRNLLRFMKERDVNNPELQARTGISQGSIQKYVNGTRTPKSDKIAKLGEALGRPPGDFYLEDPPPPKPMEPPGPVRYKIVGRFDDDLRRRYEATVRAVTREQLDRIHEEKKKIRDKKRG